MCGILRGHESTASINTCNSISVEYEFWRWSLALQPFNGLRCGIKRVDLHSKPLNQGEVKRNVLTNTNRIDHAGGRQILRTNAPACCCIPKRHPLASCLRALP